MTRVLATGVFDILHPGHLLYFEKSKELGDELVVVVGRDINVKHKPTPIVHEDQRLKMIRALKVVDMAVLGDKLDLFKPIAELKPDIITLGFDQHFDQKILEAELSKRNLHPRVVRIAEHDPGSLCSSRRIVGKALEQHKVP
jgi:FAD synthetase